MEERIWHKFYPLFGNDLKVGFETTFRKEAVLNLNPLYSKSGLVYEKPNESVKRVYEPATKVLGSCVDGDAAQVFFKSVSSDGLLFRRLVFTRKLRRHWMVATRHGEIATFGFDSWNSRDERYLSLAYPGLNGLFVPVYIKIQDGREEKGEEFLYLEVWAWGDEPQVVVQARRVNEKEAPESLISAKPGLITYFQEVSDGEFNKRSNGESRR